MNTRTNIVWTRLAALLLITGSVVDAQAQVVSSTANGGAGSLRDTIAAAVPGSVITFDPALTAGGPVTITLTSGQLNITKDLEIRGPGAGQLAVSGNDASRVFNITGAADVTLSGLTITRGRGNYGGGVYLNGTGSLRVLESRITGNTATGGAALGGGLYIRTPAPVEITDTTVSANTASADVNGQGGGIFIEDPGGAGSVATISRSTISGNAVSGNTFSLGGGVNFSSNGTFLIDTSTIAGNSVSGTGSYTGGGGVSDDGTLTVVNSTIAGNTMTGAIGVAYKGAGGIQGRRVTLKHTIVAGNTLVSGSPGSAPDVIGSITSQGFNLIGIADGSTGFGATDMTGSAASPLDPALGALADNGGFTATMMPIAGSLAIDAGDPAFVAAAATDQRSFTRRSNGRVDIGAVEFGGYGVVTRPATAPTAGGAVTLNGLAYRSDLSADVIFRIGTDPTLALGSDTPPQAIGAGADVAQVSQGLTGLLPDTPYYFQLVMLNAQGRFEGRILSFVLGGQLRVEQPAWSPLTDGASTIDFGDVAAVTGNASRTFTIRNTGGLPLTGLSASVDGTDAGDFTVGALGVTTLAPGARTAFTVTFKPGTVGARSAALHVAGNTTGPESPFDIALTGTGLPATIWSGPSITVSYYDPLTPQVVLAGDYEGLYNSVSEHYFDYENSPVGTEWAYGTTADLASLTFQPFAYWSDWWVEDVVGRDAVLHLVDENIYIDIRFTAWNGNGNFTYVRSTPAAAAKPDLSLTSTHSGSFQVGTNAAYTLVVRNAVGAAATTGAITVVDMLPPGLSFVSGTGGGWSCGAAGSAVTCTTSSAVAAGASSPPITLTVAVGASTVVGANSLTNTATVSIAGETATANNSAADPTTVVAGVQTIMFGPLPDRVLGEPDFEVLADASSGLPVSFTAAGDCTIAGRVVHLAAAGTCTITAEQTGTAGYGAATPVSQTFAIDLDTDGDGIGNSADPDDDNDGVADAADTFPLDAAESVDTDHDGIGNNADLDDDNDGLADAIDPFPTNADANGDGIPDGQQPGRMRGKGSVGGGSKHDDFEFDVDEGVRRRGRRDDDTLRLRYEREDSRRRGRTSRFDSTAVTSIVFIDDPDFGPNGSRRSRTQPSGPDVDTVIFRGEGRFNGRPGYTFEATATDQGEPGIRRDTFSLVVKDANGVVVFSESGELRRGNIESQRLQEQRGHEREDEHKDERKGDHKKP